MAGAVFERKSRPDALFISFNYKVNWQPGPGLESWDPTNIWLYDLPTDCYHLPGTTFKLLYDDGRWWVRPEAAGWVAGTGIRSNPITCEESPECLSFQPWYIDVDASPLLITPVVIQAITRLQIFSILDSFLDEKDAVGEIVITAGNIVRHDLTVQQGHVIRPWLHSEGSSNRLRLDCLVEWLSSPSPNKQQFVLILLRNACFTGVITQSEAARILDTCDSKILAQVFLLTVSQNQPHAFVALLALAKLEPRWFQRLLESHSNGFGLLARAAVQECDPRNTAQSAFVKGACHLLAGLLEVSSELITEEVVATSTDDLSELAAVLLAVETSENSIETQLASRLRSINSTSQFFVDAGLPSWLDGKDEPNWWLSLDDQRREQLASFAPDDFLCPITRDVMRRPVVLVETGNTYEDSALQQWFRRGYGSELVDPRTNVRIRNAATAPNNALGIIIREWCEKQAQSAIAGAIANVD